MSSPPLNDPTALARYGHLEVVSRLIVEGFMMGQHKSPFKGSSVEFVEHRQYSPGDEIRHIDWRALGKTGRYYVKEFEEETNLRAYLLVDTSGSMGYSASTLSKLDYARLLAGSLAYLLHAQRDAVGMVTFDTQVRERIEPSTNPKVFQMVTAALRSVAPGNETALAGILQNLLPTLKRRSVVVLISDFFDDPKDLQFTLQQFRRSQHEVILIQVLAPEEIEFPFEKPTQFRSLERGSHRMLVDPHRVRKVYLEQFQEFQQQLKALCVATGCDLVSAVTTQRFDEVLGHYLKWRAGAGKNRAR